MRHPVALTIALHTIVLAWCVCALALDPSLDVSQYSHTAWKVREGFPKGAVFAIAQTQDGYLWLGTDSGLFRYDGIRAISFQPPGDQQLPSNFIQSLLGTRDGTLWIGTQKGLARWSDERLYLYPELAGVVISSLLEDRNGTVWIGAIGSSGGRLCSATLGAMDCRSNLDLGRGVTDFYQDNKGGLWISAQNGLWRWSPGIPEHYPLPHNLREARSITEDDRGDLLLGTDRGLRKVVRGRIENDSVRRDIGDFWINCSLRESDGSLWIGSQQGLLHLHGGRVDVFKAKDGLTADFINTIFEDHEGNVWIGTQDGFDRFRDVAVPTISRNQGLSNSSAWSVQATPDGSVWIGSADGLNRWNNGDVTIYRTRTKLDQNPVSDEQGISTRKHVSEIVDSGLSGDIHSLAQHDGRLWVSTSDGVFHLRGTRFIRVPGLPSGYIFSIADDRGGGLWIANYSSLLHLTLHDAVQQTQWSQFSGKHALTVLPDRSREGGVWLGFLEGGIVHFGNGEVLGSYETGVASNRGRVGDLRFGSRGALWASTEAGLSRIKDGRVATLTSRNGLPCDAVHWSMEDDDHSVWLYTPCGLLRIVRSELDAWVSDSKHIVRTTVFGISDGVRAPGIAGGYPPTVTKTSDGKIWFLPRDGVSVIDPHHLPINELPPPVHIEQITADGKIYDVSNGLPLPARVRNVTIDYTALSLVAPEKIHFRYKLEGQDPDWREVVNDRHVQYSNLAPRRYTFRVMASNNSGVWNEKGASLEFSVLPAVYQTTWFRILCVFGFLVLLWSIYRLRIQQMQRQFNIALDARVNERTRIARELHDTLLQTFHGAMFQFQAARNLMSRRPDEALRSLDEAISETKKALGESRDAIQDLRSEPIAKGNLAEFLMSMSPELAGSHSDGHPPVFDLIEEGERQVLSSTVSKEICRIALELLRNAYQHAHAQRIETEIRYGESMFRLRIRDDGRGIDPNILKDGGKAGHWGLRGVRERADRIGARLDVWSEPGSGTEVQLLVPASSAYENHSDSYRAKLVRRVKSRAQRS